MSDMARLRDLVRWLMRPTPNGVDRTDSSPSDAGPKTPEEFERKISDHDREMATIAEIVAAVRQERSTKSAPR